MATTSKAETKSEDYYKELVEIKIPIDKRDNADVFVGHNGKGYLIKRGKTVKVPRAVALILKDKEEQEERTAEYLESLTRNGNIVIE